MRLGAIGVNAKALWIRIPYTYCVGVCHDDPEMKQGDNEIKSAVVGTVDVVEKHM